MTTIELIEGEKPAERLSNEEIDYMELSRQRAAAEAEGEEGEAGARIRELEIQLKLAQEKITDLRDANERAVTIAAEAANKLRDEYEARLKAAQSYEAQLHEASQLLDGPIGHNVGLLCVTEAAKVVLERLKEAEHEREIERSFKDQFAGLAEKLQQTLDAVLEKKSAAEARAEAAEKIKGNVITELHKRNEYIKALEHDVRVLHERSAEAATLRGALEQYPEWTDDDDPQAVGTMQRFVTCLVCGGGGAFNGDGKPSKRMPPTHKPDCARQSALEPARQSAAERGGE